MVVEHILIMTIDMNKILFTVTLLFSTLLLFGQENKQTSTPNQEEWLVVDVQPSFPGGFGKFYSYINKNMKYPKDAKKEKIKGRVLIEFVIDSTGYIRTDSTKIIQPLFESCDLEAIRLINESPKWNPGRVTKINKNVPVRMRTPIDFKRY